MNYGYCPTSLILTSVSDSLTASTTSSETVHARGRGQKYVVRLSPEERETLEAVTHKGKHPAAERLKARIRYCAFRGTTTKKPCRAATARPISMTVIAVSGRTVF